MVQRQDSRCVFEQFDLFANIVAIHGEKQEARVQDNGADIALVKGGSILATRNLVKLGMSP